MKLNPSVYVKAAKRLYQGIGTQFDANAPCIKGDVKYACLAILAVIDDYYWFDREYLLRFKEFFKPEVTSENVWWDDYGDYDSRLARSLALLLMAEMVKDE